jgi:hypothetical protein
MRLKDALDVVLSLVVVACGAVVIVNHGRLSVVRFEGLSVPLWAAMAVAMWWPACVMWRMVRGRASAGG